MAYSADIERRSTAVSLTLVDTIMTGRHFWVLIVDEPFLACHLAAG